MESDTRPSSPSRLSRLISAVEQTFGRTPKTPKDFERLRQSVFERTATLLSPTTLKRLWGYLDERVTPRRHTLDTLCRYAGWADFEAMSASTPAAESGPLTLERIDAAALRPGNTLTITWLPDREITVEYQGGNIFKILSALNTRLQAGDTFTAGIIARDQPLYLDRLTRRGTNLGVYICGRHSGIRFRLPQDI